jgi:hypothetical protein
MADEITISMSLTASKGSAYVTSFPTAPTFKADMAGTHMVSATQNIGITPEALAKGDVATIGMCHFANLDTTNYVELSYGDATSTNFNDKKICKIEVGEKACFKAVANTIYARANVAAINLFYQLIEA